MYISLLASYKKTPPFEFMKNSSFDLTTMEMAVVCDMLYFAIRSTYHDSRITRPGIKMAIYSLQKEQKLIRSASEKVTRFLGRLLETAGNKRYLAPFIPDATIRNEDPLNYAHKRWRNPWDTSKSSTDSVPDMLNKAEKRFSLTMFLLDNYLNQDVNNRSAYKSLFAYIGSKSYHSGLNC